MCTAVPVQDTSLETCFAGIRLLCDQKTEDHENLMAVLVFKSTEMKN